MCWPAVLLLLLLYHKTNRLSGLDYALRSAGARVASTARLWGAQQKARQLQPLTLATLSTHLLRACSSPLRRARPWPRPRARARRSSRPLRRRSRLTAPSAARQRRRLRSTLRCATRCALPTPPRLLRSAALTQSARLHTRAPTCSRDGWQYHASARALLQGAVFRPAALAPLRRRFVHCRPPKLLGSAPPAGSPSGPLGTPIAGFHGAWGGNRGGAALRRAAPGCAGGRPCVTRGCGATALAALALDACR